MIISDVQKEVMRLAAIEVYLRGVGPRSEHNYTILDCLLAGDHIEAKSTPPANAAEDRRVNELIRIYRQVHREAV